MLDPPGNLWLISIYLNFNTLHKIGFSAAMEISRHTTSVQDIHVVFQIPYVYDHITKLCRKQAEVIQNHENENVRYIAQGEAQHRKYERLKLGGGHLYECSSV
jgi:hypothetical protein